MSLKTLWSDVRGRRHRVLRREPRIAPQAPAAPTSKVVARTPFKPNGHFYSPVVDVDQAIWEQDRIWRKPPEAFGIDFNRQGQAHFLDGPFREFLTDYDYTTEQATDGDITSFHDDNGMFDLLDARLLFVMLRMLRPRRMVEVGSGYSSLLAADVNCRYLGGSCDLTCVEPYPPPFLQAEWPGISRLIATRVQDVPKLHEQLGPGDILFIDSSHVSKTGSDVNHLFFDVIPRLAKGVVVHVHDIFLPFQYPKDWVCEGRSWNEQYLVQAMLTYTHSFKILFASFYAYYYLHERLARAMGGKPLGGCSLWLETTGSR